MCRYMLHVYKFPSGAALACHCIFIYTYICMYIYNVNQMYSDQKGKTFRGGPSELCDVTIQNRHSHIYVKCMCN